ncbi:MAG: peptidylprolyl isomerase [Candidatus Epulonipiscium fishelsonii]|nr:MAG: peptidylprolyl isomerase [Epulopiscium sp. AS2M-Bin002]
MKCIIKTEGFGDMVFELYPEHAPITVENFVKFVNSGFYNGLGWCRLSKDYVIQGGAINNDINTILETDDLCIKGEFKANGVENPVEHVRGAISMARTFESFDSARNQFFVVHKDAHKLDGNYAGFGQMIEGFEILDLLASQPTYGPETWHKPIDIPIIKEIKIL